VPDPRNAKRQRYCERLRCRQASKAASQRRWLRKRGNGDHFRGENEVRRVQRWRDKHPGYWRKRASKTAHASDSEPPRVGKESRNVPTGQPGTLQDSCLSQDPMFLGLISKI